MSTAYTGMATRMVKRAMTLPTMTPPMSAASETMVPMSWIWSASQPNSSISLTVKTLKQLMTMPMLAAISRKQAMTITQW